MSLTVRLRSELDFFRVKCVICCWWPCLSFQSLCVIASLCRRFSKTNCGASFYRFEIPFANFFQASSRAKMGQPAHHAPLFALAFFIHCFSCARVRPVIASHHRAHTPREETALKRLHQMRWIYICTYWGVYLHQVDESFAQIAFLNIYIRGRALRSA